MKKSTGKKGAGASNKNKKGSKSKSKKGSYKPEDVEKCMAAWWRSEDGSGKKWSKLAGDEKEESEEKDPDMKLFAPADPAEWGEPVELVFRLVSFKFLFDSSSLKKRKETSILAE
jgi:hypothetical protein